MVVAKKYILIKNFQGEPKSTDFKIVEEKLGPIKDGGALHKIIKIKVFQINKIDNFFNKFCYLVNKIFSFQLFFNFLVFFYF